jgi:Na+-translocating ferredoxin:NAD+ oxidoreductase RnfG subunit
MKKIIALTIAAMFAAGSAFAQQPTTQQQAQPQQQAQHNHGHHGGGHGHDCGNCPNHGKHHGQQAQKQQTRVNADGIDIAIVKAFPTVKAVQKTQKWTEVYDAKKKLLGYALYSKPASDGIKGYKGETPVMIALSTKQVILGVYLLENEETPGFAKRVEDAGFYRNWNGMTVQKALKKEVDAVSGATFTSMAVAKSVRAALETL